MKLSTITLVTTLGLLFTTGCGTIKPPTPLEVTKNRSVKVYINDTADDVREEAFINAYLKVLKDGFHANNSYQFKGCSLDKINQIKWRKNKNTVLVYDNHYIISWKGSEPTKNKKELVTLQAKKLSNNSIEIETDGTLCDIIFKQIELKSLGFDKEAYKKLIPYGYIDFNIDTKAFKKNKLIINFYAKPLRLKGFLSKWLIQRGYTLVDNYKDADKIIYVENIAALPKTFSKQLNNFYKRNSKKYLAKDIQNIKLFQKKLYELNGNSKPTTDELSRLASLSATGGGNGVLLGIEAGFYMLSLLGDAMGPSERDVTTLGYKIIIENKNFDEKSNDITKKYHYRGATYFKELISSSVISLNHNFLVQDKYSNQKIHYDIVNYIDSDEISNNIFLHKADYEKINLITK